MEWVKLGKRTEETSLERSNRKRCAILATAGGVIYISLSLLVFWKCDYSERKKNEKE